MTHQPSPAAMRAAQAVAKAYGSAGGNYSRDAEIIDCEILASLIATLNKLQRYDLVARNYWQDMEPNKYGDWIKTDDLAAALSLELDKVYDEAAETSAGFALTAFEKGST